MPQCSLENDERKKCRPRLCIPLTLPKTMTHQQHIRPNHVLYSQSTTEKNNQRYSFREKHIQSFKHLLFFSPLKMLCSNEFSSEQASSLLKIKTCPTRKNRNQEERCIFCLYNAQRILIKQKINRLRLFLLADNIFVLYID